MADLDVHPVGPRRWSDLAALFGPSGAYSGCWCMWWRIPGGQFSRNGNAGNREALSALVAAGEPVGLLAYHRGEAVGWCATAPRTSYGRILRSPALKPADRVEPAVWSVPCFFVRRDLRRAGVAGALLAGAVEYAAAGGAGAVEGYPVDVRGDGRVAAADLYTGTVGLFARAGFTEVRRPASGRRVVMRRELARRSGNRASSSAQNGHPEIH